MAAIPKKIVSANRFQQVKKRCVLMDDCIICQNYFKFYLYAVSQAFQDGPEVWSFFRYGVPALTHEAIDWPRAVVGWLQPSSICNQLHDLLISSTWVWHVAQ